VDDGDVAGGKEVAPNKGFPRFTAVGDDVPDRSQRAAEEQGEIFPGAHRADDGGIGQMSLQGRAVAVGDAPHAEDHVGRERSGARDEARGEPIEVKVERLERAQVNPGGAFAQSAAGTKSQQRGGVPGGGESAGQQDRLALGPAAAQVVLDDENFHCGAVIRAKSDGR